MTSSWAIREFDVVGLLNFWRDGPVQNKGPFILHNHHHGCGWPGDSWNHGAMLLRQFSRNIPVLPPEWRQYDKTKI